MRFSLVRHAAVASAAIFVAAVPASAHHLMGGRTPATFAEGLLSGVGHPIIGPDHLAFLLALGLAVGVGGLNLLLPASFVAAMALGVVLHLSGIGLPGAEVVVALSAVAAGLLIVRARRLPVTAWAAIFATAGLFHGYAYGESIFGAETSPLLAYLFGLVVIQSMLSIAVAFVARHTMGNSSALAARLIGAAIVGMGVATLLGRLVPGALT